MRPTTTLPSVAARMTSSSTADVPLAVRCVAAGALVTGPTGRVFD